MVWNHRILWLSIYWECHHPNWLSYFSEGWLNHQPANYFGIWYHFTAASPQLTQLILMFVSMISLNSYSYGWFEIQTHPQLPYEYSTVLKSVVNVVASYLRPSPLGEAFAVECASAIAIAINVAFAQRNTARTSWAVSKLLLVGDLGCLKIVYP